MNSVNLVGRLTKDPEIRWSNSGTCFASFSIAIDRPPRKDGTKETDYPRIKLIGKQAENAEKYLSKGRLVGVTGSIQTGSYEDNNGNKVYTTEVLANNVEYLSKAETQEAQNSTGQGFGAAKQQTMGFQFEDINDESIPF